MYSDKDIIVAPATSLSQRAPLAIVRVSGQGSIELARTCFQGMSQKDLTSWKLAYGNWSDTKGVVDDVVLSVFRAPKSYTGQDMVEITCHGNPVLVETVVRSIVNRGGRRARPGEFTMRAVLNGKMNLLQAESVNGIIEAHTRYHADLMRRQVKGPIVGYVKERVNLILGIQAHIEATIDYGEEDLDALSHREILQRVKNLVTDFRALKETGRFANAMSRGFRVLITGEPNVGKSTLFNRLVKEERAIVTHIPGTTRDLISQELEIGGLPLVLMDSAGIRETQDLVESLGIEKIYALLEDVDLIIYLTVAGAEKPPYERLKEVPKERWIHVITKADLQKSDFGDKIAVSGLTGAGLERLEREVVLRLSSAMVGQSVYLINRRQADLIGAVVEQLEKAHEDYEQGFGEEVLSSYLNTIRHLLGELTGDTTVEDILDRMFSDFCLGK